MLSYFRADGRKKGWETRDKGTVGKGSIKRLLGSCTTSVPGAATKTE